MKTNLATFIVGLLFSFGLIISGMTDPKKVIGFLDLFGQWDPSLLFVMGGAVGLHFITYRLIRKKHFPVLAKEWHVPQKTQITKSLILGSFLFGIGWGVAGFCPGPAIVSLTSMQIVPVVFVFFMLLGMFLFKLLDRKLHLNR